MGGAKTPKDLRDMVQGRWVGGEVEDELSRRGYKHVGDETAGDYVTSFYSGHGKCLMVNLDPGRHVTMIDTGPDSNCRK